MRTVLITGASSGIGLAAVREFSRQGWRVLATMRTPAGFAGGSLPGVTVLPLDVTDPASVAAALAAGLRLAGRLDVVVNNAGYGSFGAFELATPAQVQALFDVNVFGLMAVVRAVLPHFRAQRAGLFLNVSSVGGRLTFPLYSVYHSTKWAIEGFSESLHYELRPLGIGVKLIEPGATQTDFNRRSQAQFARPDLPDYDGYTATLEAAVGRTFAGALSPDVVARTIYQAATDGRGTLRYPVGNARSWALLRLRQLLPTPWFLALIRSTTRR
ncbi:SDR family oxidoreductase [Hymenobacter sp. BT664]|uniref:SDR family oxidoreductase n=1 Tax=Hymenobacter montanus TaxID=2771359 RepID=A0A927GHS4_9BACT|nr:SDR family oxidoreductase [Hymenobacter montanus]MBD2766389.1 SDR family oxidoreductase [Hymenobacter montanus]